MNSRNEGILPTNLQMEGFLLDVKFNHIKIFLGAFNEKFSFLWAKTMHTPVDKNTFE